MIKQIARFLMLACVLAGFYGFMVAGTSGCSSTSILDTDGDGIADVNDTDVDGDGVADDVDLFPSDPSESADLDADGVGDNSDSDVDGDGIANADDCDPDNVAVFPGASDDPDHELIDANCDGVDGDVEAAIWVSTSEGNDANPGTMTYPVQTMGQGIVLAQARPEGDRDVYVVAGTYAEDLLLTANVSLYGGYSPIVDGVRSRNLTTNRAELIGADGVEKVTVTFHDGPVTLDYTLLAQNSQSSVQGLVIDGDPAGPAVLALDADLLLADNDIYDDVPTVERDMTITVAGLISTVSTTDRALTLSGNTIHMMGNDGTGSGGGSSRNIGVLGFPALNADHGLTVQLSDNVIEAQGEADMVIGVHIADDDANPADTPDGDGAADLSLIALNNQLYLHSSAGVTGAFVVGGFFGESLGPDADALVYAHGALLTGNQIHIVSGSGAEGVLGINVALTRNASTVANNEIYIEGDMEGVYAFYNLMAETNLVYNTLHVDTTGDGVVGMYLMSTDGMAPFSGYTGFRPGTIASNIFSLTQTTSTPASCVMMGMAEAVNTTDDGFVNAGSPAALMNNDFYHDTNCTHSVLYMNETSTTLDATEITVVDVLNTKSGFRADDPTTAAGNISVDPLFANAMDGDFSLLATSPCVDTGYLVPDDDWTDMLGVVRPQGDGVDMGAYEQ